MTFQTERVFLENHPDFASNWGLVEDEKRQKPLDLGRDRTALYIEFSFRMSVLLLAGTFYLEAILSSPPNFSGEVEKHRK